MIINGNDNNSPIKDHSIVINRNISKDNNNNVTFYIDLYDFCHKHELIITNFKDDINKLK
jgi:hypothetical protein